MNLGNVWYHDGTGFGWPALETRRTEETREVTERATREVTRQKRNGEYETVVEEYDAPLGYTITTVTRDLIVFYTGSEKNSAGPDGKALAIGQNVLKDVPEGVPTERGTCSLIAWQPGTPEHARMVTHGLAEGAEALRAEAARLKQFHAETELALQAVELKAQELAKEHGIEVPL